VTLSLKKICVRRGVEERGSLAWSGQQQQAGGHGQHGQCRLDARCGGDEHRHRALARQQTHVIGADALQKGVAVLAAQPQPRVVSLVAQRRACASLPSSRPKWVSVLKPRMILARK
jgi:hypothetical protein